VGWLLTIDAAAFGGGLTLIIAGADHPHRDWATVGWVLLVGSVVLAGVLGVTVVAGRRGSPPPAPEPAPPAAPPPRANLVVSQGSPAFVAGDSEVVFNYQIDNASHVMATHVGLSFGKRDGTKLGSPAGPSMLNPGATIFASITIARLLYDRTDDPRLIISWTDDAGTHTEDRALGDTPPRRSV
jgi:hypothetical protein